MERTPNGQTRSRWTLAGREVTGGGVLLVVVFVLGAGLRLLDLTDPPLDFNAWRQLRSASVARGMFYEASPAADPKLREQAIELGKFGPLEPPLFEHLVAATYLLLGHESLWLARLYAILFWMVGGAALFGLAQRTTSFPGAVVALLYFLFLPFSVDVSRAFLPDVPMVMLTVLAVLCFRKWMDGRSWFWATAAGLTAGAAILVKVFSVYPLALSAVVLTVRGRGLRRAVTDPQVWSTAGLSALIPGAYYLLIERGGASDYLSGWVWPFTHLLADPWFYLRWAAALQKTVTLPAVLLAVAGIMIASKETRGLLLGLWAGYFLFGASVPSLIISHSYYQALLVPIAALSLAPLGDRILALSGRLPGRARFVPAVSGLLLVAVVGGLSAQHLMSHDYRKEILGWIKMGRELPPDVKLIGLTHDYNTRLRYYGWRAVAQWPNATDFDMQALAGRNYDPQDPGIRKDFERMTSGYDMFIVTLFGELDRQPMLKTILSQGFPVIKGDGYVLYDLRGVR